MVYEVDERLEADTNRWMRYGAVLLVLMAAVFPLYRWVEPTNRAEARESHIESLAQSGEQLWNVNCASCHGLNGQGGLGGLGPALNSKQFLQIASDEAIETLVAVGVPGTQMNGYSQDFAGPLTSEQIRAITVYVRSWEPDAPDRPDWRNPQVD